MGRLCATVPAGLAILSLLASGCGNDPFGAPARPAMPLGSSPDDSSGAKVIYMVVPSAPEGKVEVWSLLAQREANARKAIFRVLPAPGQPPVKQTDVIRKAVGDGASVLIVVPSDEPDLPQALAEAESKNVPVVLLGRSIPAPSGTKSFTFVDHDPYEPLAKKLVTTAIDDAKAKGRAIEGSVFLVSDKIPDQNSVARLAALRTAIEAAGLHSIVDVQFDGSTPGMAKAAVIDNARAHPDVLLVLADEGEGMMGAAQARGVLAGKPSYFVAGFAGYRGAVSNTMLMSESCLIEGHVDEMAKLAVIAAIRKIKGEPAGEKIELAGVFIKGNGQSAVPVLRTSAITAESVGNMVEEVLPKPGAGKNSKPQP